MNFKLLRATTIIITTTIGAGIYAVPFAINQNGILVGILDLLIVGTFVYVLHRLYLEVILKTSGEHQLAGYGEIYLGKIGKTLAIVSLFTGIYGALLAYTIKSGQFIALISNQPYPVLFSLLFFIIVSTIIFLGYRIVSVFGIILLGLTISLIGLISLISLPHLALSNFQPLVYPVRASRLHPSHFFFFPYGIFLFTLMSDVALPEAVKTLHDSPPLIKKAIFLGTSIPIIIYLIFSLIVIGVCGKLTSTDAISGLLVFLPIWAVKLGAFMGIIIMTTAFLSLGYILRKVWQWDFGLSKPLAFVLAVLPPLLLFLLENPDFINVLNLAGALTGGFTGILIILLYIKAKKII
ncbi:hypothetical protein COY91_04380 [Candidatus Shapirobacteria bacterium CG_4_10_14_0_8_um_filter_39_15]|nr:MAG: hypothetical protein COY91_04380 [Candidatus Shapirobacteria bacterium CG_4_10_14_0_8_um_filter_39_15]